MTQEELRGPDPGGDYVTTVAAFGAEQWAAEFERRTGTSIRQQPVRFARWLRAVWPCCIERSDYGRALIRVSPAGRVARPSAA